MGMRDEKPLKLIVTYNWPQEGNEEAELHFDATPGLQQAEMLAIWGPGPRQQRSYPFQEPVPGA